jgi:hypothetical protein
MLGEMADFGRYRWLIVFLTAVACGPTLTDEPVDYTGSDELRIAVLCGATAVAVDTKTWVKFATLYQQTVTPLWDSETLEVHGGVLTRRAAGRPTTQNDGRTRRIETFWVMPPPNAKSGDTLTVGPLRVGYRRSGGGTGSHSSAACEVTIK